jgi:quercetin dioxygenase-like cupin family protein/DNA-binding transcriptional ArsR family regulator
MPRPRRSHLFPLDADVLSGGASLITRERDRFYGLEVARMVGRERSTVYKSLRRLVAHGLLTDEWDAGRRYYRLTDFGRRSVPRARGGARVFGRTDERLFQRRRKVRGMELNARRIVTGHDGDGRAVIVSDGEPPGTIRANGFGVATWLWLDGVATTVDDGGEEPDGPIRLEPPPGGCSVRIIRFPGASEGGGDWIPVEGADPDRPGMHATDTLDFMVVIGGRIALGLDDGEHELGPGDVVIQRGNPHRWRVVGDEPCTYLVCMLRPDPSAAAPGEPQQAATATATGGPRRLVADTGGDGRSRVLTDGAPPCVLSPGEDDGVRLVELWQTGGALGAPDQGGDPEGGWELEPRAGGIAFRSVRLPAGHDPGDAGWHTTATIDVDVVLSGQLELSLPDTPPVVIGPGEAVVQRGTNHSWKPVGDEAVEFVSLMLAVAG